MDPSQMTLAMGLCGAGVVAVDAAAGVFPCPGCGGMNRDGNLCVGCGRREECGRRGVGEHEQGARRGGARPARGRGDGGMDGRMNG